MVMSGCMAGLSLMLGCSGMFGPNVGGSSGGLGLVWVLALEPQSSGASLVSRSSASEAHTFEAIVIDWEERAQAQSLAASISLRFPDAQVQLWRSNDEDLAPPFVMVQVRRKTSDTLFLRLLTHQGAVYTREVASAGGRQRVQDRVTRELTSTLLAIAEGLIEPDQSDASPDRGEAPATKPSATVPASSPSATLDFVATPDQVQPRGPTKPEKHDEVPERERWGAYLGLDAAGALPLPAFPSFGAGWGLNVGYRQALPRRFELGGAARWMTRAKGGVRMHRLGISAGLGKYWRPRSRLRYALMGLAQLEAWWLAAFSSGKSARPRPEGTEVLLGAAVEQSLLFRVRSVRPGGVWVGPQLTLGYGGLMGRGFSALGVYVEEPENDESALIRLGGAEVSLGLRFEFVRN